MKHLFKHLFVVAFLLISTLSFSQRVLTQDERQSLLTSSEFKEKCEFAARDYAAFMSTNDGSSANTETLKIKWAKDRIFSVKILTKEVQDEFISIRFINLAKSKQFNLGAAPQTVQALIAAWVNANTFEEFASPYFTLLGDDINMSIGN